MDNRAVGNQQEHSFKRGVVRRGAVALLFSSSLGVLTGCMTTLGYVPEQPRSGARDEQHWGPLSGMNAYGEAPDYKSVRKWSMDIVDAYSSRAAANRHADSAGAALAGTGAAALVGLAAFGGDPSWITGIPIGTAFAGGLLGIYANEYKSEIYGAAANLAQAAIINSDARNSLLVAAAGGSTQTVLDTLKLSEDALNKEILALGTEREAAEAALTKAAADATDANKTADEKKAANEAVGRANTKLKVLAARLEQEHIRLTGVLAARDRVNVAGIGTLHDAERTCLWKDVHTIKTHVENLITTLTPVDATSRLAGVGTSSGKKNGDWIAPKTIEEDNPDLVFLRSPLVSSCGIFM